MKIDIHSCLTHLAYETELEELERQDLKNKTRR
jgi:hypothetical protein